MACAAGRRVRHPRSLGARPIARTQAAFCGGTALYLLSVSAIQRATPRSLGNGVLAARLSVAAICVALAPLAAYVGTPVLVGFLSLALIGLTVFENSATDRSTGDEADAPEA